jgi:hypothetical protein
MGKSSACIPGILETIPNLTTLLNSGKVLLVVFPEAPRFARMGKLDQLLKQEPRFHVD